MQIAQTQDRESLSLSEIRTLFMHQPLVIPVPSQAKHMLRPFQSFCNK